MTTRLHTYMRFSRLPLFVSTIVLLVVSSCSNQKPTSDDNYSELYSASDIQIHSEEKVYHPEEGLTVVYLRIAAKDLAFVQNQEKLRKEALVIVDLKALPLNPNLKRAVDSVVVRLDEIAPDNDNSYIHTAINLNIADGYGYRGQLKITDVNSGKTKTRQFTIDKRSMHSRQNFLVFQRDKRLPVYKDYITRPNRLRIKNNQGKDMTVRYYRRHFPLPPPPFSNYSPPSFKYDADSIFTVRATPDFSILEATKPGFYHVLTDDNQKEGYTLFTFADPFPLVATSQQMFESVRYLTTEWEYREMKQKGDVRQAVEKFWLDCAGSKDKARELINLYYGRVEEANRFFTSYVEGWKTDRGLIHIVYGKPNIIYKSPNSETWIYGEDRNVMSLSFTFVKVINPFTENDYRLERDENFKASWYRAIESWRNGRIYAN